MEFVMEKYAMIVTEKEKKRQREIIDGIELPHQESIRTFGEKENCKYLEILEVGIFKQTKMKKKKKKKGILEKNKITSQNQILLHKSYTRNK